jgi:hypothetical protein
MALGSTQPLREMSIRNLPGGKGKPAHRADLTAIYEPIVYTKCRSLDVSQPYGPCYTGSFTFSLTNKLKFSEVTDQGQTNIIFQQAFVFPD